MKKRDHRLLTIDYRFSVVFLSLLSMVYCPWSVFAGDEWLDGANGYARGGEQAKLSGKPMIVYFYTDWCPYCRKFEKHTLANPDVQKALSAFIKVRINPEKGARENQLGDQYRIEGFPSVYFENPASGQITQEMTRSLRSAKDFFNAANEFAKVSRPAKVEKQAVAAPDVVTSKSAAQPAAVDSEQTLYLKSGRSVSGKIISENAKGLTLAASELGEIYFSRAEIQRIEKAKE